MEEWLLQGMVCVGVEVRYATLGHGLENRMPLMLDPFWHLEMVNIGIRR